MRLKKPRRCMNKLKERELKRLHQVNMQPERKICSTNSHKQADADPHALHSSREQHLSCRIRALDSSTLILHVQTLQRHTRSLLGHSGGFRRVGIKKIYLYVKKRSWKRWRLWATIGGNYKIQKEKNTDIECKGKGQNPGEKRSCSLLLGLPGWPVLSQYTHAIPRTFRPAEWTFPQSMVFTSTPRINEAFFFFL